jgi:hypothetical protein
VSLDASRERGALVARCAAIALIALSLPGCAGALKTTALEPAATRERYLELLSLRENAAHALDAEASLWLTVRATKPIPGVLADLALGSPDAFRLRVHSPLGTVIDLGGRGSGLTASFPSRRAYVRQDAAAESLGIRSPAEMVVRVCSANWRPPESAWTEATRLGAREQLRWMEGSDSIRVTVDVAGLPAEIEVGRADRAALRIRYLDWSRGNPSWPSHIEIGDTTAGAELKCRLERVRGRTPADSARLAVAVPAGATRLEWSEAVRAVTEAMVP